MPNPRSSAWLIILLCALPLTATAAPKPAGRVFGEPITAKEFEAARRLYRAGIPGQSDEDVWRFLALLKESERAGIRVDPKVVRAQVSENLRFLVARANAMKEVRRRGADIRTPEGSRLFQRFVLQSLMKRGKAKPSTREAEAAMQAVRGVTLAEYTEQARREQQVQAYLEHVRANVVVSKEALRAAWATRQRRPVVELYEVLTDRFRPRLDAKPGTPGHITDAQVAAHYPVWRRRAWPEPRVTFEYLGVPFASASRDDVAVTMDAVADALEAQSSPSDLKALRRLIAGSPAKLEHGAVGPTKATELASTLLVSGFATRRWILRCKPGQTSEVLGGPKGWFVLRAIKVEQAPTLDQARALVKREYARGDAEALKRRAASRAAAWAEGLAVELEGAPAEVRAAYVAKGVLKRLHQGPIPRGQAALQGAVVPAFGQAMRGEVFVSWSANGDRRFLWCVTGVTQPAPTDPPAAAASDLRRSLQGEFVSRALRATFRRAKSITPAMLRYAEQIRRGARRVRLRRIFVRPDQEILAAEQLGPARKRLALAQAELAKGAAWKDVQARYSETTEDLPGDRQVLRERYGAAFAQAVLRLPQHKTSGVLRSYMGLHLVHVESGKGYWSLQQILIKVAGVRADRSSAEVAKRAWAAAKQRIDRAERALKAGALFLPTALKFGDDSDRGRGESFWVKTLSPYEQAAVSDYLEWNERGISASRVPPVVQVATPQGTHFYLFTSTRDGLRRDDTLATSTWQIRGKTRGAVEAARTELVDWITAVALREGANPSWERVLKRFRGIATKRSDGPMAAVKGGAVGRLGPSDPKRVYGLPFLVHMSRLKTLAPGVQTGVFKTRDGYHLVRVVAVEELGAAEQREDAEQALLDGTGWD